MSEHICFESVDCKELQYMKQSNSWVCLRYFMDLKHVDSCMRCRFMNKQKIEKLIKEGSCIGRLL